MSDDPNTHLDRCDVCETQYPKTDEQREAVERMRELREKNAEIYKRMGEL